MKTHLEFAKKHLKDPQTVRNKIPWFDEPLSIMFEGNQALLINMQSTIPASKVCW